MANLKFFWNGIKDGDGKLQVQFNHRKETTLRVLAGARDNGDDLMIEVCTRVLAADRLGWRKHGSAADWRLIQEFDF